MWPWGHAVVGYLAYSGTTHVGWKRPPSDAATVALLFGTQFPDLVDKPLAWSLGVLPSGRSLAHSTLTAVLLVCVLYVVFARRRAVVGAFALGYASHLLADLPSAVLAGDLSHATYLLWPILPSPRYVLEPSFQAHLAAIEFTPVFLFQVGLLVPLFLLWRYDGYPGRAFVFERLDRLWTAIGARFVERRS